MCRSNGNQGRSHSITGRTNEVCDFKNSVREGQRINGRDGFALRGMDNFYVLLPLDINSKLSSSP